MNRIFVLNLETEPKVSGMYNRLSLLAKLSNREKQVFELLGAGLDTARIAKRMRLSVKTVEIHRDGLKDRLKFQRRTQLLGFALERNLMRQIGANQLMSPTAL